MTPRLRPTARLLVIDQQQRLLLFHIDDGVALHAGRPEMVIYWITPGGGVEPGESYEQAAQRELYEETGIETPIGPLVWHHERLLRFTDESVRLQERYYLVTVSDAMVSLAGLLPYEQETHMAYRWWSLAELEQAGDHFIPTGLPQLIAPIMRGEIPAEPPRLFS
jgi:ADP-ribose pyrophosphatase YjhB (NUDIX family)